MPSKRNKTSYQNKRRAREMRKTIMRDPELPLGEFPPLVHNNQGPHSSSHSSVNQRRGENQENKPYSTKFHEPKLNPANQWRHKLAEINQYRESPLESLSDLTIGTRKEVNKEISSKLNFKPNHLIFKNLIPLEDKPETSKQAALTHALIVKSQIKVNNPNKAKADEFKRDVLELIDELMASDYKDTFKQLSHPTPVTFQGEFDYMGFSKFTTHRYHLHNKEALTAKYKVDQVDVETERLFNDEHYLDGPDWAQLDQPRDNVENECACLKKYPFVQKCP